MTTSCIFCKIASHEIPAKTVLENDLVLAFHDLNPQAPTHVLVIPKKHIVSISDLSGEDKALVGDVFFAGKEVAEKLGLAADGYRFVINTGKNGGQSVLHLHLHVLGGRTMQWPPG